MDTIDLNSSPADNLTPVKARLGRFLDEYSPEHLNLTPKHIQKQSFADVTPTVYSSEKEQVIQHRSRTGRALRTKPKNVPLNSSFEENQSFPGLRRKLRPIKMDLETPTKVKTALELVRVDGPYGLRFNNSLSTTETTGSPLQQQGGWQHCINTRKAIFTIEPSTSKILIVNNKACCLLGYTSNDLVGLRLFDLMRNKSPIAFTVQEDQDEYHPSVGPIILLSGKVIELVSKDGCSVQVSLWIRQLDTEGPCLVVAEPVRCKNVIFTVDPETWLVLSCDNEDAALLFQAESTDKLIGVPMTTLIPSIQLPAGERGTISKSMAKQKVTGRTLEGGCFPLSLRISRQESSEPRSTVKSSKKKIVLEINVRVTFNVSGLLVVDEGGTVTACNHYFAQLTFGKPDCEVIGRSVQELIPRYCSEADRVPPRQATLALNDTQDDTESDTDEDSCDAFNGSQKSACMSSNVQQSTLSQTTREKSSSALCLDKSCSLVTHTPTPTQDMVSSISTTEQRNTETTSAVPDVTSAMSGISIDDENYCHTSISKSRSENILRSEQSSSVQIAMPQGMEKSDSIYYTSHNSQELTPTGGKRVRAKDPSLRLSLDSNKCRSLKAVPFLPGQLKDDKSSVSLDFCDSNETSADFLTPINETALSRGDFEGISSRNCNESIDSLSNDTDLETQTESAPRRIYDDEAPETPCLARRLLRAHVATSTPQPLHHKTDERCECSTDCQHRDGTYRGVVLHRDGSELNVVYTVSNMQLGTGRWVQCVWLGVQLEDAVMSNALVCSIASTTDTSLVQGNKSVSSRPQSMSLMSQCGEEQVAGEYHKNYATLKQIGKGAYGCVKMAYRRSDRLMVIAKFILKEKVGPQFWVSTPDSRVMPLEISLLRNLKHPNIVSVIDVFENDKYFQLVMEKHGAGMDLFEFIERRPTLSEPLVSYIFRQIGQAVEYLHKLNVLHRDIKDENVIIDDKFHVKLIDFGSAAFMSPDVLFSTFYGTTEYCSPEVLAGNKYAGPELEMWSMGTTLYVLTFFVNPFSDIEDTVHGQLQFPHQISEELEQLLRWMLCKEPVLRCSMAQLMSHPWIKQPVNISNYVFHEIIDCDIAEANPEKYYSGSLESPRSSSLVSLAKERSLPSEVAVRSDGKNLSREEPKRNSMALHAISGGDRDAHSDNYSLRSSADILDISSKPVSDAALTDISSDATGHAACDIDCDCDHYECDSWDECEQESFS